MTTPARHPELVSQSRFMAWLRAQEPLSSRLGYTANDIDLAWMDYKRRRFMLVETKCFQAKPSFQQRETLKLLHQALRLALPLLGWRYHGTHLIQFERTGPDDGRVWIDGRLTDAAGLVRFLSFER